MLVFEERGKLEYQEEKPLGARERTNNRLNPHMASTPGFEPGPHWWEVSALTTAPSLAPHLSISSTDSVRMGLNPIQNTSSFFIQVRKSLLDER